MRLTPFNLCWPWRTWSWRWWRPTWGRCTLRGQRNTSVIAKQFMISLLFSKGFFKASDFMRNFGKNIFPPWKIFFIEYFHQIGPQKGVTNFTLFFFYFDLSLIGIVCVNSWILWTKHLTKFWTRKTLNWRLWERGLESWAPLWSTFPWGVLSLRSTWYQSRISKWLRRLRKSQRHLGGSNWNIYNST